MWFRTADVVGSSRLCSQFPTIIDLKQNLVIDKKYDLELEAFAKEPGVIKEYEILA
jgi:hypothetical protein